MPFDPDIDDGLVLIGAELLTPEEVTRRAKAAFGPRRDNPRGAGSGAWRQAELGRYRDAYRDPVTLVFDPTAPSFAEFTAPHREAE